MTNPKWSDDAVFVPGQPSGDDQVMGLKDGANAKFSVESLLVRPAIIGIGDGDYIHIIGGDGGTVSGNGSLIAIDTGSAVGGGEGGTFSVNAGAGVGANNGGGVTLQAGTGGAAGDGGIAVLQAGPGGINGAGGSASIRGGSAIYEGSGGQVLAISGSGSGDHPGGRLYLSSGDGGNGVNPDENSGNGGNVELNVGRAGVPDGAGVAGVNGNLIITGLPTSAAGLPSGAIWLNSNVLTIVP